MLSLINLNTLMNILKISQKLHLSWNSFLIYAFWTKTQAQFDKVKQLQVVDFFFVIFY